MKKVVNKTINHFVKNVDTYNNAGSTWLIFTETKQWVIELTKDGTLWYNYNFFKNLFKVLSLDVVENQNYITKWVEETIINGVKNTIQSITQQRRIVEDTIENGVKDVRTPGVGDLESTMEFMNENNTLDVQKLLDDVIENGVKEAKEDRLFRTIHVMNAIVNGVKHVEDGDWLDQDERIDDIIESGVKETKESMLESLEQIDHQVTNCEITENINDAIENGVKKTKEISNISLMSEIFKVNAKQAIRDGVKELKVWKSNRCEEHGYFELVDGIPTYTPMIQVKDVLENGVKEMQPLPAQDGNRDWGLYYQRQGNLTKPHTEYVKEVIEDSYNHMGRVEGVIRNTDKDGI